MNPARRELTAEERGRLQLAVRSTNLPVSMLQLDRMDAEVARIVAARVAAAEQLAADEVVKAVERELDDADQIIDALDRPNRIAVWGVRRVLLRFGGKEHRWPVPAERCVECDHLTAVHGLASMSSDEERCRAKDCGCLLSANESAWGRDEAMDEEIANTLWEDAVTNDEPWVRSNDDDRG